MKQTGKGLWTVMQYLAVLFITVCFTGLIVADVMTVWLMVMLYWVVIPAAVIACISFFGSLKCDSRNKKILLALNTVNIFLLLFFWFNPAGRCDADTMERHYAEHGLRMERIYRGLYDKMTPGSSVEIEFEWGDVSGFRFSDGDDTMVSDWRPSDEEIDRMLAKSGLSRADLDRLEDELDDIGCRSIALRKDSAAPYEIGFRRRGYGEYSYRIYPEPLSAEEQARINESPSSIVYSPRVVFEYTGGVTGSLNFKGKAEYLEKAQPRQSTDPK